MPPSFSSIHAQEWAAIVIAVLACFHDLRRRRIPNWISLGAAGCGFAYAAIFDGASGLAWSLGGWLTGALPFLPFFVVRGLGAGDVKLAAALGAWLLPAAALWMALYTMLVGGIMALVLASFGGYLRSVLATTMAILWHWRASGLQPFPGLTLADGPGPRLPYALPITVGAVSAVLWK